MHTDVRISSSPEDVQEHHILRAHSHTEGQLLRLPYELPAHPDLRDTPLPEIPDIVCRELLGKEQVAIAED